MKVTRSDTATIRIIIPRRDIIKRAVRLGAEIRNLRLSDDLSDQVIRGINNLLLEHKVIFFRDQKPLDAARYDRFAIRLSNVVPDHRGGRTKAMPSILKLGSGRSGGRADQWRHTVIILEGYPKISLLRSMTNPACDDNDTVWSDMAAAYQALPLSLRMFADQLWAVHKNACGYPMRAHVAETDRQHLDEVFTRTISETEHPVVRVHPETGERTLVIGDFVQRFVGLQKFTGQQLLRLFNSYITARENTVRWSWKPGDVAIWDSRATQYHEARDFCDQHHVQSRRASTDCDLPPSIDAPRRAKRVNVLKVRARKPRKAYRGMQSRSSP